MIADYAASNQRVPAILQRLGEAATIGSPEHAELVAAQSTPPEIMEILLDRVDQELGGVESWLDRNGWDADDQSALESRLLERA